MKGSINLQNGIKQVTWIKTFNTGVCTNIHKITQRNKKIKKVTFPALVFLLKHEQHGYILFDTGYSEEFFKATIRFPERFYRLVTPVYFDRAQSIEQQLSQNNISPTDIKFIILSHFHGDHTSGLKKIPDAKIICSRRGYRDFQQCKGMAAVRKGYLKKTLPDDFENRMYFIEDCQRVESKKWGNTSFYDVFGDRSLLAQFLEGHAAGQFGVIFQDAGRSKPIFFCADATWSLSAIREQQLPHMLARFIMDDYQAYRQTFDWLCQLYTEKDDLEIIPSHERKYMNE